MMMTVEQHLTAADRIRSAADKPGMPPKAWAEQIARNHEVMAILIAHRRRLPLSSLAPE
jgi:hypothetical protein